MFYGKFSPQGHLHTASQATDCTGFGVHNPHLCLRRAQLVTEIGAHTYAITWTGHITNEAQLCQQLAGLGVACKSLSHALLLAYHHFGTDFVKHVQGHFALAIYNGAKQRLLLARDPLGVMPLFTVLNSEGLTFSSHLQPLAEKHPQVDTTGLREIFGIGPARTPGRTAYKYITEVLPGHIATYDRRGYHQRAYWQLQAVPHPYDPQHTTEMLQTLVKKAVDSSFSATGQHQAICLLVSNKPSSALVQTFAPEGLPYLHADNVFARLATADILDALALGVKSRGLPAMADADGAKLVFLQTLKKLGFDGFVSSLGAQHVFAGYPWFVRKHLLETDHFPWSRDVLLRQFFLAPDLQRKLDLEQYTHAKYRESLQHVPHLSTDSPQDKRLRQLSQLSLQWFLPALIEQTQRSADFVGLTPHMPFLTPELMQFMFNVPGSQKLAGDIPGYLLKHLAQVLHLPVTDTPYKKPRHTCPDYNEAVIQLFKSTVLDKNSNIYPLLDEKQARNIIRYPSGPWFANLENTSQMAYLIQVEQWLQTYRIVLC